MAKKWIIKEGSGHNNIIISEVLSVIDKVILFKLSNYFLKNQMLMRTLKESQHRMIGTSLLSMVQQISVQLKSKNMAFQRICFVHLTA